MKFFVSPPERTAVGVSIAVFIQALAEAFPSSSAEPDGTGGVRWYVGAHSNVSLAGELEASGNTIVMEGDVDACAEFACWFRRLVPAEQPLVFYDEGYSADVVLEPTTDATELASPFLAP